MASRLSSPVLIGRSNELGRLRAAVELAIEGRTSATLVAGEAGVGKTRLVAELAELARHRGATVLIGGCLDLGEGSLPYAPVVEALRGLARLVDADQLAEALGQGRSDLARLVPDLGPAAEDSASSLSIASAQGRLFELLLAVLGRLAARAPVVFIAEDLHWSDRSTRDLLAFLVRNVRDAGVMLLFTYRSDELHRRHPLLPLLAELERTGRVDRLELRPFDRAESAAQLRAIADRDLDAALVDSIHARSGGNAFFAEELLVAAGEDGRSELPQTLRDVLLARVAGLAEPTQEFLRVASAAGQRVDPALLAEAVAMDEAELYGALRECVGRQVLVPDPTAGRERYAFRHALLQEAIYDDLLPGERVRLHSTFARTLEARSAGDASRAGELAYHWHAANDLPRALGWAVAAGSADEARYAFPEAIAEYERAIDLWDQVPDATARAGRDRVDVLAALAGVARFEEPARAVAHIRSAIRLVAPAGDPIRAGLLHERLGRYAWVAGQHELAREAYKTAMGLIPAEPPSEARARAVAGLAQIVMLGGRFEESRELADQALTLARAVGAREIEGHALNTRGVDRGTAGEVEAAVDDLRAALAIAEDLAIVDDVGRAYANWSWVLDGAGRLVEAIAVAEVGIAAAKRMGSMRFFGSHMLANASDAQYRLGRWEESERLVRRAEDANPLGINAILTEELLGRLAMARGHFDEAEARLRPLAPLADRAVDIQFVGPVRASLAELALWQARPEEAAGHVDAAIRIIGHTPEIRVGELYALGLRAHADIAERARARRSDGLEQQALAAGDDILDAMRRRHVDVVASRPAFEPLSEGWLLLCDAEAARLHRRPEPEAWAAVVRAWDRLERPYLAAYARWRQAEALLAARADRSLGATTLRAAHDVARRLGAAPLVGEVTAVAARARLVLEPDVGEETGAAPASSPADDAARFGLTAREREVLALVALGRTNRQIADDLFISANTAGVHVSNILGKLDVTGRGEAAALAHRLGLVEAGGERS